MPPKLVEFDPLNGEQCQQILKKAHAYVSPHYLSHQVQKVGEFQKEGLNKKIVTFHIFAKKPLPLWTYLHQLWFRVAAANVIICDKFSGNWSREVEFVGAGSQISGSHRQSLSLLILCCLYRAASDTAIQAV